MSDPVAAAQAYEWLVIAGLLSTLLPTLVICALLWPRPWTHIFRGGELLAWIALLTELVRRLDAIFSGPTLPYLGDGDSFRQLCYLGLVILFAWLRLSQHWRHRIRSREQESLLSEYVEAKDG